jgi:hypothetical protein
LVQQEEVISLDCPLPLKTVVVHNTPCLGESTDVCAKLLKGRQKEIVLDAAQVNIAPSKGIVAKKSNRIESGPALRR